MWPQIPAPYRTTTYARPQATLYAARRVSTPDGAQLACFVYGPAGTSLEALLAGEPVLALHGNGGSHGSFAGVIDRLCAAHVGVVAFDARAQGQSGRGSLPLTYELLAQDALCVLDALGVRRVHVLGHSDGGIEALLLARDHSERVCSIVTGGANLTPEGVEEVPGWDEAASEAANRSWAEFMDSHHFPSSIDPSLLPAADDARLASELFQLMLNEPHIEATSLAAITCPTCVLVGEHDCIAPEQTQAIAAAIPGARLVVVPGVGHSLPRQAPDSVALQVLSNILLAQARGA